MKLKSMAITPAEQKEREEAWKTDGPVSPGGSNRYPFGLEIRLDNDAIEKLGLDAMPKVGKRVRIEAVCMVTGAHINETTKGPGNKAGANRSLELQIQKLGLSADPQSATDAVDDALDELDS